MTSVQEALDRVMQKGLQGGEIEYLTACKFLIEHRSELNQGVYIQLPDSTSPNTNPTLSKIKEGSEARCDCGNERIIYPLNQREEYEPSDAEQFTLDATQTTCYLKPVGGFKAATYCKLTLNVMKQAVEIIHDPFAPLVLSPDMLSTKGFWLSGLAPALESQAPDPGVYIMKKVPVFGIYKVTMGDNPSMTILPDKNVELLTTEPPNDGHFECRSVLITQKR